METEREELSPGYSLALEIHHVASSVQSVIKGLQSRPLQGQPDWLRIQVGTKGKKGSKAPNHTVRDYVIYHYAKKSSPETGDIDSTAEARLETKNLMALCPLGFDFTSNAEVLQVDHFFPSDLFLERITNIEGNTELRHSIRQELLVIDERRDSVLTAEFINLLIPQSGPLTALKCVYYNYAPNLWPLSGPVNAKKGARDPFEFAMGCVRSELDDMGASLNETAITQTTNLLSSFNSHPREGRFIIPHIVCDSSLQTGLEFFLLTPTGKAARKICSDVSKIGQMGMESAYALAAQLQQPKTRSAAKGMRKTIKLIHRVRKKILPHPSDSRASSSERDSSSLDSQGTEVLEISRNQLTEAIEREGRKKQQRKIKKQMREIKHESSDLPHGKSAALDEDDEWISDEDDKDDDDLVETQKPSGNTPNIK